MKIVDATQALTTAILKGRITVLSIEGKYYVMSKEALEAVKGGAA